MRVHEQLLITKDNLEAWHRVHLNCDLVNPRVHLTEHLTMSFN